MVILSLWFVDRSLIALLIVSSNA